MSNNHNLVLEELQNIKNELTKIKYPKKTTPIIVKSLKDANKTINDMINDLSKIKAKLETIKIKKTTFKSPEKIGKTKETRKNKETETTGKTGLIGDWHTQIIKRRKLIQPDDEESSDSGDDWGG